METRNSSLSRPLTPESPLSSLYRATNTIDDLTLALSKFTRVNSPEPQINLVCCCGSEFCESLRAWYECKTRLESRLTLSAEVGQALLQRHEAYVRRHESKCQIKSVIDLRHQNNLSDDEDDEEQTKVFQQEQFDTQYAELLKEKQTLEKCLNQAIVNNEVTEVSNKTLLQELYDSKATISRLTAHNARSIGWDTRLTAALKEHDDMRQERDSECHRARLAESRFAALKDKTIKLQTEVRRLQEALEGKRSHRLESSGSLLQDARTTLESLREAGKLDTMDGYDEITRMLESLVKDNETLKHDNAELQQLLTDTREDFATLQEEYEEHKANPPIPLSGANTPNSRHSHRLSVASITSATSYSAFTSERKPRRNFDPRSPDLKLTSPRNSLFPLDSKSTSNSNTSSRCSPSRYSMELETPSDGQEVSEAAEKRRSHRPLVLLSRSRGVQTEPPDHYPTSFLSTSPMPSLFPPLSPHDHSEASSFSESSSAQISSLIDRITSLLARMTQTDPLTLTNRLKRQNLKGADVGHLSKSTISNILSEVNALRQQYRSLLEEDKAALPITRKDLRGLFKFLRDVFSELGQIRTILNEVILDPTLAPRVSERAFYPERDKATDKAPSANLAAQNWITPISRLFSSRTDDPPSLSRLNSPQARNTRFIPKSGPALGASATTVNVEFSGIGGRLTTNATAASPIAVSQRSEGTAALKDIFAGTPQLSTSTSTSTDTWVVVPPPPQLRRMASMTRPGPGATVEHSLNAPISEGTRTIGRNTIYPITKAEIPRAADAAIGESQDQVTPLLQRTLRRRGLSDSSIHSTFIANGQQLQEVQVMNGSQSQILNPLSGVFKTAWSDGSSVLQALSRTVHNFKLGGSGGVGSEPNPLAVAVRQNTLTGMEPSMRRETEAPVTESHPRPQTPRPIQVFQAQASSTPTKDNTRAQGVTTPTSNTLSSSSLATSPKSPKARKAVAINPRKVATPDFSSWATASFTLDPASGINDPFIAGNVAGSFREESFVQRMSRRADDL